MMAGGRPFDFSVSKHSRVNDTTLARRGWVTDVAFTGARPFLLLEGSGVFLLYVQEFDPGRVAQVGGWLSLCG